VKPLLDRYQVDAYLCGHDHTLQVLQSAGVHYFVSGAGALNGEYRTIPQSLWGTTDSGFMSHRIWPDRMDVSVMDKARARARAPARARTRAACRSARRGPYYPARARPPSPPSPLPPVLTGHVSSLLPY